MQFNSLIYPFFSLIVFVIYWSLQSHNKRNIVLLVAGMVFYSWWDYRFLLLLMFESATAYYAGRLIQNVTGPSQKKKILIGSLSLLLGTLFVFKYCGYFIESAQHAIEVLTGNSSSTVLKIILPLGISFHTFQALSYVVDVYYGTMEARTNPITFFLYVTFFPQLVAGPIEKAHNLLPQLETKQSFDYNNAKRGIQIILVGFWLKCVLADNLSGVVDTIFDHPYTAPGYQILLGTYLFAFQIYGDFAGYTYIAIGSAALFNIKLTQNFSMPYLSQSVREFWTKWHISLTSWFKEYVYIWLLGGNRKGIKQKTINVLLTFVISGIWHGAHIKFIIWGLIHGVLYFAKTPFKSSNNLLKSLNVFITFNVVCLAWIFFRAKGLKRAYELIARIFTSFFNGTESFIGWDAYIAIGLAATLVIFEILQRTSGDLTIFPKNRLLRWGLYLLIGLSIFFAGSYDRKPFVYFQF